MAILRARVLIRFTDRRCWRWPITDLRAPSPLYVSSVMTDHLGFHYFGFWTGAVVIRKSKDPIADSQQTSMSIRGVVYQHWSNRGVWFRLHRTISMTSSAISLCPYFLYNRDSYSFLVLSLRNLTRGLLPSSCRSFSQLHQ